MNLEWGAVCRPKEGQSISGDTYVVEQSGNGHLLLSVIDGLGGGEAAARASGGAATVLQAHPDKPLDQIIRVAHTALHNTRGAVIAILRLEPATRQAHYIGVGNIGVYVYSNTSIKPISKNGILGYRLPTLLQLKYTYNSGDTFVLYSDGISARFSSDLNLDHKQAPQHLAETILHKYGKSNDDATVVVVRDSG
jgi:serine/threonine protein phosphatase PrpC